MKKIALFVLFGAMAATTVSIQSCVKKGNDEPADETGYDPHLTVTNTIAELLAMPANTTITDDIVVSGVVVMDDRSGNYYKKFVIQDSTGGLEINLDENNIYNDYPVGRKVYVKCKGLAMAVYGGMRQLGAGVDDRSSIISIPFTQADKYIVKANYPNTIVPDTMTYDQLSNVSNANQYLNRLVVIKDAEFAESAMGQPYASASSTSNRELRGCGASNANIVLRTSNYAKFQGVTIPGGNGTITALYTKYNTTPQLFIRDTSDVKFTANRCDGSSPNVQFVLNEAFTNLSAWNAVSVSGTQVWGSASYGNPAPCAVMTGYSAGTNYANEDWLISRSLSFTGYTTFTLTFETAARYGGDDLGVFISTDYTSGAPSTATWTALSGTLANVNGSSFVWTPSGNIDLSTYAGQSNVHIAFKYTSSTSAGPTWELDNVKIKAE